MWRTVSSGQVGAGREGLLGTGGPLGWQAFCSPLCGLAEAAWAGCPTGCSSGEGLEEGAVLLLSLPCSQGGELGTRSLSQEGRCQGAADECVQTGDMETGRGHHFQHQGWLQGRKPAGIRSCLDCLWELACAPLVLLKGHIHPERRVCGPPQGA